MTPIFAFKVVEPPQPKERARTVRVNGITRTYTPAATRASAATVRKAFVELYGNVKPLDHPVVLVFTAYMPMPASTAKRDRATVLPSKKPDLPNMVMQMADALSGYAWVDDARITQMLTRKRYCGQEGAPIHPCWVVEVYRDQLGGVAVVALAA